jgi:hypothetical protein
VDQDFSWIWFLRPGATAAGTAAEVGTGVAADRGATDVTAIAAGRIPHRATALAAQVDHRSGAGREQGRAAAQRGSRRDEGDQELATISARWAGVHLHRRAA